MQESVGDSGEMLPIEKVRRELRRYEHLLVDFSAREKDDGSVELLIALKETVPGVHLYKVSLHPRDIESSQFSWSFQRLLYDCLHDYVVELFVKTPQSREESG
jgi:hypothetical protein